MYFFSKFSNDFLEQGHSDRYEVNPVLYCRVQLELMQS